MLWENSSGRIRSQRGSGHTQGSEGQPGKAGAATQSSPASMYLPNWGKLKEKVGDGGLCLRPLAVLSHVICFGQWDNSQARCQHRFKRCLFTGTCFLFCCAWEPCNHYCVNKPGLACCEKRYMAKSSLLPQVKLCQLSDMWVRSSFTPGQATSWPQGSDEEPVQPRTVQPMHKLIRNNRCLLFKPPSLGWFVIPKANRHNRVRTGDQETRRGTEPPGAQSLMTLNGTQPLGWLYSTLNKTTWRRPKTERTP